MKITLLLSVLVAVLITAAFSFTPKTATDQVSPKASIERGKAVYQQYCLACHQADGAGVPRMTPPLKRTKWVLGDKKELIGIVLKGLTGEIEVDDEIYNNAMPAQAFLKDQQIADVLTYVRNSFSNKASAVTAAEVKAVRAKIKKV